MKPRPLVIWRTNARSLPWVWRCRVHPVGYGCQPTQAQALAAAYEHCRTHATWMRRPVPTGRYA